MMALPTGREAGQRVEAPLPAKRCSYNGPAVQFLWEHGIGRVAFPTGVLRACRRVHSVSRDCQHRGVCATGVFVAADKTYWIPGDLGDVQGPIIDVLPFRVVHGTAFSDPNSSMWLV